jgi:hypothetical protein
MDRRGPLTIPEAVHMKAAQAAFWGIVLALWATDAFNFAPFMLAAPFAGAYCIWITVRIVNRRDDPRYVKRPPDDIM